MDNLLLRIIASVLASGIFCACSWKMLGAMQQSGYRGVVFWRWMKKKENMFFNRLCVLALCLALSTTVTALCFSFLGTRAALGISLLPFLACGVYFCYADRKFALKVPAKRTGRLWRLLAVFALFVACVSFILIALLAFLSEWNGSQLYALIAYAPFAIMPMLLPNLLRAANACASVFENARNKKFVKRAGRTLADTKIIRVGVVGSYGKTSVKNILKTILSEKYTVVETPASYNTPIGVAKTVFSPAFADKQVLIAEMGARRAGDIAELCRLVAPDYAIFTGVCEQHIETFGSLEKVWNAKKEIFAGNTKVVCGSGLRDYVMQDASIDKQRVIFADALTAEDISYGATETKFTLRMGDSDYAVQTKLLGKAAVENILLAVTLALEMGLEMAEIVKGIAKIDYVPHRLQLLEKSNVYVLDDAYNCNPKSAEESLLALSRFSGRKCIITPGIVECGVLQEKINGALGKKIAKSCLDKVILVGDTLVGAVKTGYQKAGGDMEKLTVVKTVQDGADLFVEWMQAGDAVLFLNDLPDIY